ncbi:MULTISPECIES: replication initiation protein [Halomonadaceae]|jgi:plasmid replication initiation protein|uniref:Replication initiation protein n=2 Tax=Vreelandella TaxID=3137766 RepID=A0A7Z0S0L2_9GAMM|nr:MULTISPECIES: replication initiation protein [Halomonas]NYS80507.1 replication initiation protein [Halomonas glaciei]|tara:strand:- start:7266 stop:8138 length:873 start_codon:yes stop_codon:yes gene_type:complete
MHDAQIYKANALVEASYRLSIYEQRVILACISKVRRDEPLTDQKLYRVSAQEIADMSGTQIGTAYQNLKAASERLFERRVSLHASPNGDGKVKVRLTRWVQTIEYDEGGGAVSLRFGTDMVPYLSQLTEQFTRYALADIAKMTSAHAVRLYELLAQWRGAGERSVSIEWLREAFQLENRYSNIRDFKRWVIEPAVKQVNEYSPLWCKWSQRKTGRRVSHLTFTFGEKAKTIPPKARQAKTKGKAGEVSQNSSEALYGIPRTVIESKARPGEGYEDTALRLLSEAKQQSKG